MHENDMTHCHLQEQEWVLVLGAGAGGALVLSHTLSSSQGDGGKVQNCFLSLC